MSYKGFKRVLGESSLERKCLWWFGTSLAVMLLLSFKWFGRENEKLVYERNQLLGRELVRTAWFDTHFWLEDKLLSGDTRTEELSPDEKQRHDFWKWVQTSSSELGAKFKHYAILPVNPATTNQPPSESAGAPKNEFEAQLIEKWSQVRPQSALPTVSGVKERIDVGAADDALNTPIETSLWEQRTQPIDGVEKYLYYQPVYATSSCIPCHTSLGANPRPLTEGDLMAVMRIEIDHESTRKDLAKNSGLMWGMAVTIGFLSMFLLYFIIRYIIVKPVQHLREVSDAVREGNVEQRAEINTGDEFEELAAAFNRMLRRLLRQQDALQSVNSELDGKIDQLAQANMRLFEMNRLKSDFLATMSHELRTPLNSILGFSDVLSTIDKLDTKQKRYVDNIQRSGRMLLEMINDILDLAKMESGKMDVRPTQFGIASVVSAQCDMARPLSERKNIDLDFYCEPDLPPIRQDQAKLQQILNNLLSNAIKFTPEGGKITVRAGRTEMGELELQVEDTGIGISEADQAVIFEKFRQGNAAAPRGDAMTREHSGTGLGLSIVRELCRLLGGDVSVRSIVGKGSTFTVTLPWMIEDRSSFDPILDQGVAELTRVVSS